jgi:hypothetical protein
VRLTDDGVALFDRAVGRMFRRAELTGDYLWDVDTAIGPTGFRPLRGGDASFAQAA